MTVVMHMQSKKWVTVFCGAPSPSSLPQNILVGIKSDLGVSEIIGGCEWGQRVLCVCIR